MEEQDIRNIILRELAEGPKRWSELLSAVREVKSVSQSNFYYHLTKLVNTGKITRKTASDGLRKYELAEAVKVPPEVAVKGKEFEDADRDEIAFLLNIITRASTDEAVKHAFTDLEEICKTKRVTKYREVWEFFISILNNENYERYWPRMIDDLIIILKNARASKDTETIEKLRKLLLPRILEIAGTPTRGRDTSVNFIDELLSNEEKFEIFKEIAEKIMKQEGDVTTLYPLAKLYKNRKMEIWRWLYSFIESSDEKVSAKASELLSYLRHVARHL